MRKVFPLPKGFLIFLLPRASNKRWCRKDCFCYLMFCWCLIVASPFKMVIIFQKTWGESIFLWIFILFFVWKENKICLWECPRFFFLVSSLSITLTLSHTRPLSFPSRCWRSQEEITILVHVSVIEFGGWGRGSIILLWRSLSKLFWDNFRIKRVEMWQPPTPSPVPQFLYCFTVCCHNSFVHPVIVVWGSFENSAIHLAPFLFSSSSVSFLEGRTFSNVAAQLTSSRQGELCPDDKVSHASLPHRWPAARSCGSIFLQPDISLFHPTWYCIRLKLIT